MLEIENIVTEKTAFNELISILDMAEESVNLKIGYRYFRN